MMEDSYVETKVEALEDNRTKVTVTVDAADIDARIKKTYKDFANKYNFPGFRKGKAPRPIIDNALGAEAVRATVTDDVVNGTYPLAIDDCDLYPIAKPEFDETDLVEAGKPYTFSFTVTVKPEIEISSYEPVEIELPAEGTTDAEIDEQIDALREHYYSFEDASAATKVKEDSYIDLAMKATDDKGEEIPSLTTENRPYGLGANLFPAEFDEQLVGLKKGQTATFTLDMPADPPIMLSALAGKTEKINFEVEVKVVKKKIVPEVNDEWAKEQMGFESVEDLRARIAESVTSQKADMMPRLKENACLYALAERVEGDVPEAMLEDARELGLSYLFDRMIIQVYSELMYKVVDNIHPFPHYIYTLYAEGFGRTEEAFREIAAFCEESGILGVTMWDYWWDESYLPIAQEYGVRVFAHTVNDPQEALALLESGISAVYTDTLAPSNLEPAAES